MGEGGGKERERLNKCVHDEKQIVNKVSIKSDMKVILSYQIFIEQTCMHLVFRKSVRTTILIFQIVFKIQHR